MNFWLIYSVALGVALIDIAVKEWYVKQQLLQKLIKNHCPKHPEAGWNWIPNFWKDSIPGGRWYRIRWSYVLNGAGILLAGYLQYRYYQWIDLLSAIEKSKLHLHSPLFYGISAGIVYWWLIFCNAESIFYQWFKKLVHLRNPDYKWFDLYDNMEWLRCLPFNKWFAKYLYHCYKDYETNPHKLTYTGWINPEVIYLVCFLGNIVLFAVNEIMKGV
jgi:hypothetical protein